MRYKYKVEQKVRIKILNPDVYAIGTIIGVSNRNGSYYAVDLGKRVYIVPEQRIRPYESSVAIVNVRNLI